MSDPSSGKLTCYNYINFLAYIANFVIVHGIGVLGWFNLPDNAEISAKYQTLVTPAGFTFAIWAIIFIFQAIFSIVQLLPKSRSHPLVQNGVRYWYGLACACQIFWTFAFTFEVIWLSCIFMLLLLFSLCALLLGQRLVGNGGAADFWLLRFPFQIHAGWICAASAVNVNVVLVGASANANFQIFAAVVSLLLLLGTALFLLCRRSKNGELNIVIPLVLAWAFGGVWAELQNPKQSIQDDFDSKTIDSLKVCSAIACFVVLIGICIRTTLHCVRGKDDSRDDNVDDGDNLFDDPEGSLRSPPSLT